MYNELKVLSFIVFNLFFLRFILKLIGIVLYADQKPALANSIGPLGNILSISLIFLLTKTTESSLLYLAIVLSLSPIIIMILATILLYTGKYKTISPSIRYVRFIYAKDLLNIGVQFFIIQVAGLILYQTSNIIIAQFFGPAQVTPYTISYKLFSIINMVFGIVMIPFWSAFTEAWALKDIEWIKRSILKLFRFWLIMVSFGFILLIGSPWLYKIWVGETVKIPFILSSLLFIYFSLFTFGGIFNMFINGIGKIKLQLYSSVIGAIFFPLIAIFLIKNTNLGISALVIATIVSNFFGPIMAPIQFRKLINNTAKGVWNE
jgi:O-antigen/teichoic acid export membrane protein